MKNRNYLGPILAGTAAGVVTGLFGAGGGMVLVPLLMALTDTKEDSLFPTSLSIMLPICLISLTSHAMLNPIPWKEAVPYLIGSGAGGVAVGIWGQRIPTKWLHRILGFLILWGGFRYLC